MTGETQTPPPDGKLSHAFRLRRFRNWFFLGLLYAGYYLCRYNLTVVTPELRDEYELTTTQIGWLSTGRDFGYAIGMFINGLFADALGGKASMAIGATGTIVMQFLFFFAASLDGIDLAVLLLGFVVIRTIDGYVQSLGSPGMVKINAAWFRREERGTFAGIFGAMIQLGNIGVVQLSKVLLNGFSLTLIGIGTFSLAAQNWRTMFVIPPLILAVLLLLMWINVKNHPEEAGHEIPHDDGVKKEHAKQRLPMGQVFMTIASNPLIWVNAGAYMCTGFVRRAYDFWWPLYFVDVWEIGKESGYFAQMGVLLPISAIAGSFGAGYLSDRFFRSRRSPVATSLYGLESLVILAAALTLPTAVASPWLACAFFTLISLTCNSSHSIIGTAAVMDIGGRQMAGFALGVVNSFQYIGSILAGFALGGVIKHYGWDALFWSMLPFSLLGTVLMLATWRLTRGRDVRGA